MGALSLGSAVSYGCPNLLTRDRQARLNIPCPGSMRAPAEGQGNFALEPAIDEVAHSIGMDPLEFRLRNYAQENPLPDRMEGRRLARKLARVAVTLWCDGRAAITGGAGAVRAYVCGVGRSRAVDCCVCD
ncbi:molybdopterin cofactor-binding domain-containing protein [Actinacidiphila guanduensis]|uniref:molybdopterin cofactor-binding domain-containing protein n=1 Tax=Actinacidiphila guanduensis TaxID=310781 RepID=UPI001C40AC41|nr:molybdopterin cofactor-binding domain-containing protein [Actinacidiphila guanduensis]